MSDGFGNVDEVDDSPVIPLTDCLGTRLIQSQLVHLQILNDQTILTITEQYTLTLGSFQRWQGDLSLISVSEEEEVSLEVEVESTCCCGVGYAHLKCKTSMTNTHLQCISSYVRIGF